MFKNFRTYELAGELYKECLKLKGKHYIKDQLERASFSVVLNLSEGSAKSGKDRRRFFLIALGSLREVQTILKFHGNEANQKLADEIGACLFSIIQNLS